MALFDWGNDMTRCMLPVAAAVLGAGALLGTEAALAAGCDRPLDAALRLNRTSYHMTMTTTDAGRGEPEVAELISTEDATYVRLGGAWQPGPKEALTLGDLDDMPDAEAYMTCDLVRSEQMAGTTAEVWRIVDQSDPDELKLQTVWIAAESGRILQMEVEIRDGTTWKTRTSAKIDYENVLPPR